jgi:Fe-S-cluster containining protein
MRKEGFSFSFDASACARCNGACCRGESGYIWVKYDEIEAIAKFVNLSLEEFATIYLRRVKHRYSLREKKLGENDFACVFFDETKQRCEIYPVRPQQCRTFPFWEQYKIHPNEVKEECPGILLDTDLSEEP